VGKKSAPKKDVPEWGKKRPEKGRPQMGKKIEKAREDEILSCFFY